ncbi:MAG: nicotinate-nucleotide--dimethylbenzimidazole phosphoribosyltransferase [Christensenellales bacterium]
MTETELKETIARIASPDEAARAAAHAHWAKLAKPLGGLGRLETMIEDAAALTGREDIVVSRRAVFVLCADNGVVAQGVSQTDQSVTRAVAENLARRQNERLPDGGCRAVRRCAGGYRHGGEKVDGVLDRRIADGTADFTQGPAMTRAQTIGAIEGGMRLVRDWKAKGYTLLATGEMGIGNTTTSSAVAAALLGQPVERMTGRGAGLSDAGMARKIDAIRRGIGNARTRRIRWMCWQARRADIAGLCGVFLGGAIHRVPIVMDGFISGVAALCAVRLCPKAEAASSPAMRPPNRRRGG